MRLGDVIKFGFIIALFGGGGGLVLGSAMVTIGLTVFVVLFSVCVLYGLIRWGFQGLGSLFTRNSPLPTTPLRVRTEPFLDRRTLSH